ncbi:MAG: DUF4013 domain-containing protein [Proteobacteria bacterium]|nr:DUF4013 domain-containing protein [Pseudomonadota bacterium]
MIDLENALKFPTKDDGWKGKILIGGLLNILPIVNFIPIGYAYRIFRNSLEGEEIRLSEWNDWGNLFVQGLVVFLIAFLYNIASIILFVIHPVLGFLAVIAVALLFPTALARYAKSGNFSAAFQLREIWAGIQQTRSDYFVAWLVMIGICIVLLMIGSIPVLGWLISAIIGFYTYLVFAVLFGEICSRQGPPARTSSTRKR